MKLFSYAFVFALALPACAAPLPSSLDGDSAYTAGTKAMNEGRWQDAVTSFDQVVATKGKKADAALYWKAYSLLKVGKPQLAAATCTQLSIRFHESGWNHDCAALTIELPTPAERGANYGKGSPTDKAKEGENGGAVRLDGTDSELKLLALNSLVNKDPAQAMPILRGILTGKQPQELKQHALFVLTQSRSPEALAMMKELIMGAQGTALQQQAVLASGAFYGKRNSEMLVEAYRASSDSAVKRAIVSALFISEDDARMVEMARQEKDLSLKRSIVSQLALMKGKAAQDYMIELLK